MEVKLQEAKTTLSKLLRRVEAGETVVISRNGKPAARLVPVARHTTRRVGGADRGLFRVPDDFDEPCEELNRLFNA